MSIWTDFQTDKNSTKWKQITERCIWHRSHDFCPTLQLRSINNENTIKSRKSNFLPFSLVGGLNFGVVGLDGKRVEEEEGGMRGGRVEEGGLCMEPGGRILYIVWGRGSHPSTLALHCNAMHWHHQTWATSDKISHCIMGQSIQLFQELFLCRGSKVLSILQCKTCMHSRADLCCLHCNVSEKCDTNVSEVRSVLQCVVCSVLLQCAVCISVLCAVCSVGASSVTRCRWSGDTVGVMGHSLATSPPLTLSSSIH